MTKEKKKKSIKWGYSLLVLSFAFIVASGLMFYFYYQGEAPASPTNEGNVAGKVKAAGDGEWSFTWTPSYSNNNMVLISGDTLAEDKHRASYQRIRLILDRCNGYWDSGYDCNGLIDSTEFKDSGVSHHPAAWVKPELLTNWAVRGEMDNKRFAEEWSADRFTIQPMMIKSKSSGDCHAMIYVTGKLRYSSANGLEYENWIGDEAGKDNTFKQHRWTKVGERMALADYYGDEYEFTTDAPNRCNYGQLENVLYGMPGGSSPTVGYLNAALNSAIPASWTVTGCFTETGSCN